jgi:hypothetical protein
MSMARGDAAERPGAAKPFQGLVAEAARKALAHERAGRFRDAWGEWEALRAAFPRRTDWNAPLAASYLRFAFGWTADGCEGSFQEAEEALLRGVAILTIDVNAQPDDVARLMLLARACEQRCMFRAFGGGLTRAVRDALEAGDGIEVTGDPRQVTAAAASATIALDLVALSAPSLAPLAGDLAQSCLRLAAMLEAVGASDAAADLVKRAEIVLGGPRPSRPALVAIEGGAAEGGQTPPRRPRLTLVTSPTG